MRMAGAEGAAARHQAAEEYARGAGAGAAAASAAGVALLDDLNTPSAVSELSAPLKTANDLLTTKAGRKQPNRLLLLAGVELAAAAVLRLLGLVPMAAAAGAGAGLEAGDAKVPEALPAPVLSQLLGEVKQLALVRAGLSEADVQVGADRKRQGMARARAARARAASPQSPYTSRPNVCVFLYVVLQGLGGAHGVHCLRCTQPIPCIAPSWLTLAARMLPVAVGAH